MNSGYGMINVIYNEAKSNLQSGPCVGQSDARSPKMSLLQILPGETEKCLPEAL